MATRTLVVTLGQQFGGGTYAVKSAACEVDSAGSAAAAVTDQATAVAYANTIGLTGSLVASVTLTAAQGNSLTAAMGLVTTDVTNAASATTAGDLVAIVNTTNLGSVGKLNAAFRAAGTLALGSGFKP